MEQQRKKRGENWSSDEKEILRQLIAQSASIIEDKSTKTSVNMQKTKEWKNIQMKFNELTAKCRTDGELKLAWKRMKLNAKSNISRHRREQTKTGGGEKPPSPSPEDLQIMAIAPHDFVIEVNDYDSDALNPVLTAPVRMFTDPIPGPSFEQTKDAAISVENPDHHVVEVQAIYNEPNMETDSTRMITVSHNEPGNTRTIRKKKKMSLPNSTEAMRHSIIQSNTDFKRKQLEMMEIEHKYNIKIAELKIKKLELEIELLKSKKHTTTEE